MFLHKVFGYRGVVLFPWLARVYDRDLPSKSSANTREKLLDTENNRNVSINSTISGNTILVGSVRVDEATGNVDVNTNNNDKMDKGIASNLVSREANNNSTVVATEKKSVSKADETIKKTTEAG